MAKMKPAADAVEAAPAAAPALELPAVTVVPFCGVPDGLVYPRDFAVGDLVLGELAAVALREGWAERKAG